MGQAKTSIEINGTVYNPSTGAVLDGFVRRPQAKPAKTKIPSDHSSRLVHPNPKPTGRAQRHPKPSKAAHKPTRSQTLMRHTVKKPAASPSHTTAKTPALKDHQQRQQRARQATKSTAISRFAKYRASNSPASFTTKVAPLPVKAPPTSAPPIQTPTTAGQLASAHAKPRSQTSASFEAALANATSHQQKAPKKAALHHRTARKLGLHTRTFTIVISCLAVLLVGAFLAYQNSSAISMRYAATKAGFDASLPGYTPPGFTVKSPIATGPGQVTVNYHSVSGDDRAFQVSQKPSNWTSDSLLSNFVDTNQQSYQTYQDKGKTIYIYNGSNATWVNGGVWYQVTGNANLSSDQLISIADSL